MVYVKREDEDGTILKVPLEEDGTVYTDCPFCGKEQTVSLEEFIDSDFDFATTQVMCEDCSKLYRKYANISEEQEE